ncbi:MULTISPECIES: hypothetical protein [unclassified Carboxylicivirga]|uniref:hypothetical protein n=1 Tax=Carboxylicivirga TaxID=1628153 RepID=UPI003D3363FE
MDGIGIEIFGRKELDELFNQLRSKQQLVILRGAFKKAARPLVLAAKKNLNGTRYKKLRRSIGVRATRNSPNASVFVGARIFGKWKGQLGYIVNAGTDERRYITKRKFVHRTGRIQGNNFWDDAIQASRNNVEQSIEQEVFESFTRYVSRANKRRKSRESKD